MEAKEPGTQRDYLLYVPSTYSDGAAWPLVVACHGTWPYDTATFQMREWAKFAENRGLIVLAPQLSATKGDFPPSPEDQIALQGADEQAVLAMVSAVKRQYRIAEERVFMTGWSAGAYAILHIGLRNPDVFRALYIRQGTFDARFMDAPPDRLDPWQRIKVVYGMTDLLRDQSKEMVAWLRGQGQHVDQEEISGSHRRTDPKESWRYFAKVAKESPWVRIRTNAVEPADPRVVRFCLDAVPRAVKQKWFFGDGAESPEATPTHTYAQTGRYEVKVNVALEDGRKFTRSRAIRLR